VSLKGAKIDGDLNMTGAGFDGLLDAEFLHVGGSLFMRSDGDNKASFQVVNLNASTISGHIFMQGASFGGELSADSLQLSGSLEMRSDSRHITSLKNVILRGAKIGEIFMSGASFHGTLAANALQVGGNLFMRDAQFVRMIDMTFAHVGGNLDLRGATLSELDLACASIAGDLRVGGRNDFKSAVWTKPGTLNLHKCAVRESDGCDGRLAGRGAAPSRRIQFYASWRIRRRHRTGNAQSENGMVGQTLGRRDREYSPDSRAH
jgi:hypothetical protein